MHHAHERGNIHRDLKPANVLPDYLIMPVSHEYSAALTKKQAMK
jgi:hypothetical protein